MRRRGTADSAGRGGGVTSDGCGREAAGTRGCDGTGHGFFGEDKRGGGERRTRRIQATRRRDSVRNTTREIELAERYGGQERVGVHLSHPNRIEAKHTRSTVPSCATKQHLACSGIWSSGEKSKTAQQ